MAHFGKEIYNKRKKEGLIMSSFNIVIETTIREASVKFYRSLNYFYPALKDNDFCERNMSFYFAYCFMNRSNASAFMEIPLGKKTSKEHLDSFVFDHEIGIFIEVKRFYSLEKAKSLLEDINRMEPKKIRGILDEFMEGKHPSKLYRMVIASTWNEDIVNWWAEGGEHKSGEWNKLKFPENMIYDSVKVKGWREDSGESVVHWLYAYSEL